MNKDEWLKDVNDTYNDLLNLAEEIESLPAATGINGTEVEPIVDSATETLQQVAEQQIWLSGGGD